MKTWPIHSTERGFTVCMFLPMEIVSLSESVKVVDIGKLVEIPSEI